MFNFCFNALFTIFVVYAIRSVGLSSLELGLVIGAGAVAALIGALFTTRLTKALGFGRLLLAAVAGTCLAPMLLLAPRHASPVALLVLLCSVFVSGFCAVLYNIGTVTLRQVVTPNRLLARMNGTYRMVLFGAVPLGALAGGALGSVAGLRAAMVIAVVAMLSPVVWIPFSPVFRLKEMPAGPDEDVASMPSSQD
jgi:MFS family permease